jgi:hypothetical protein
MAKFEVRHYKVLALPKKLEANVVYYVLEKTTGRSRLTSVTRTAYLFTTRP